MKVSYFSIINQPFTHNSKQVPLTVVQTSFEYYICWWIAFFKRTYLRRRKVKANGATIHLYCRIRWYKDCATSWSRLDHSWRTATRDESSRHQHAGLNGKTKRGRHSVDLSNAIGDSAPGSRHLGMSVLLCWHVLPPQHLMVVVKTSEQVADIKRSTTSTTIITLHSVLLR